MASSGNIAVFNPLSKVGTITFSEGNTIAKHANNKENTRHGTTFNIPNTGKWYFECKFVNCNTNGSKSVMFTLHDVATEPVFSSKNFLTQSGNFISFYNWQNRIYISNSYTAYTSNIATQSNAIVSCAIDRDNSHMWVAVNNTWINGTPDFTDGTNKVASPSASLEYGLAWSGDGGGSSQFWTANFGQDSTFAGTETAQGNQDSNGFGDFYYAPPTDFLAISSANLPISADIDPAQTDDDYPSKQFGVVTYTGNGTARSFTGLGFQPDMLWIKMRNSGDHGKITDSVRGVQKALISNTTGAETTDTNGVTAFGTDGFSIGSGNQYNLNEYNFVAWCWKGNGGTTASNSDGSITSTVQANTKAGFSIINFTSPNNTADQTVGHGLSQAPEFIMSKNRDSTFNWDCFHIGLDDTTYGIRLNTDGTPLSGRWGTVNSSTITTKNNYTHSGTDDYVFYAWHSVEGYSKFGSYTGNGNADGPFIYTGFRPRMIFFKWYQTGASAEPWGVFDTARATYNPTSAHSDSQVYWNTTAAASAGSTHSVDFLSNGVKLRGTGGLNNVSGGKYIYGAWGDVPFKYNNTF